MHCRNCSAKLSSVHRCTCALHRCTCALHRCTCALHRCTFAPVQCKIAPVRCRSALVRCRSALVRCKSAPVHLNRVTHLGSNTVHIAKWKPTLVILRINRAATCVKWSPKGKIVSGYCIYSIKNATLDGF